MRSSEPGMMNPFDQNAIEAALKLKQLYGATVTLLSMGPKTLKLPYAKDWRWGLMKQFY